MELIGFTRWLGVGAVIAVSGLVANALLIVVRGRVKENAVLRTLGFPGRAIGWLVLSEGGMLGLAGGVVGVGMAAVFLLWQNGRRSAASYFVLPIPRISRKRISSPNSGWILI